MIIMTHNDATVVGKPRKRALDYISSPVAIPESVSQSINVPMALWMRSEKAGLISFSTWKDADTGSEDPSIRHRS